MGTWFDLPKSFIEKWICRFGTLEFGILDERVRTVTVEDMNRRWKETKGLPTMHVGPMQNGQMF